MRTDIRRRLFTKRRSVSHTPENPLFPLALGSPFGPVLFCRNSTACGSLKEWCQDLLTLLQRFSALYHDFCRMSSAFFAQISAMVNGFSLAQAASQESFFKKNYDVQIV